MRSTSRSNGGTALHRDTAKRGDLFLIKGDKSTEPPAADNAEPRAARALDTVADRFEERATALLAAAVDSEGTTDSVVLDAAAAAAREAFRLRRKATSVRKRAARLRACGTACARVPVYACPTDGTRKVLAPIGCGERLCPRCRGKLRSRAIAQVTELLQNFTRPRFLTLTIRSGPVLKPVLRVLLKAWDKLRRSKWWIDRVTAAVLVIEVTKGPAGWHPHLHIVFDGRFLERARLVERWHRLTRGEGTGAGVYVKECDGRTSSAAAYMAKYIAKDCGEGKGALSDVELAEFVEVMTRLRTRRTYGNVPRRRARHSLTARCPTCGGPMVFLGWTEASQTNGPDDPSCAAPSRQTGAAAVG